ncbi:sensor histidine kinase [Streptomyces roseifaciens]|uniref:sensor histidine kinase n=1 Tax=Streptomyces roseifaciens TaxID=1488406 RepID=UPI000717F16D|nr:histidine kinase [Streptomyces roseifaciens]
MTPTSLLFSPAGTAAPSRARRRRGWLLAGLCGLWLLEGRLLTRDAVHPGQAGGHHAHLVVWAAGLLVALCVLPWGPLAARAAAAIAVSWSATGYLMATGEHLPVWGLTESAALLVLLALVAWRAPVRAAVATGVALAAGVLVAPVRDTDAPGAAVVAYALVVAGVTSAGLCLRYRDGERARAVAAARDAERLELAGELHDFVSHHVAAMTLLAKATGTVAKDEQVAASLRDIQAAGDEALTSSRRLLRVLQQDQAHRAPLPGLDGVSALVDDFRRTGPGAVRVELHVDPRFGAGTAPELAASVHRIVAEGLANVAKHSPGASAVRVTLREEQRRLFISVRDDGPAGGPAPHAPEDTGGLGLVGLTERADAIGGSLTAGPVPGGGWEVLAVLPVQR